MKNGKNTIVKLNNIVLRKKKISTGYSLYLDIHVNGKRRKEYLKLYLSGYARPTAQDKANLKYAEQILAEKHKEMLEGSYDINVRNKDIASFTEFFKKFLEENPDNKQIYKWKGLFKRFVEFRKDDVAFKDITPSWLDEFKKFLLHNLKEITASTYFSMFCQLINLAFRYDYIQDNPVLKIKKIPRPPSQRTFLTLEEVARLHNTPNPHPESKRAFLFACFSGLRYADVVAMKWSQIEETNDGKILHFKQQKTGRWEMMYLADQAVEYLGKPKGDNELVFNPLSKKRLRLNLIKWAKDAGIKKHVTFHVARHTFATMALNIGVDLKTVSKLLGHSEIKTTEIYAKILDKTKKEAVKKIPQL